MKIKLKALLTSAAVAFGGLAVSSTTLGATVTGSFNVKLTISSACLVTAAPGTNDVNFGSQAASATANLQGSQANPITVACSNTTPYVINLTPSNASTTGAGVMTAGAVTAPYQLRQTTGQAGAVWGNTGTAVGGIVTPGNGVSFVGTGLANPHSFTVFATVASTDFTPGTYSDLVNVSVAY